jgi:hypothetical protein
LPAPGVFLFLARIISAPAPPTLSACGPHRRWSQRSFAGDLGERCSCSWIRQRRALVSGEISRATAEAVARAMREKTGASHALAVPIEVGDGPYRIDFGGSIYPAIAAEEAVESSRSGIYGGRHWVPPGAVELGLDCLRRYLQGLPVTERTDFERV